MKSQKRCNLRRGVTLIEVAATVVIIGLIVAIGVPSYKRYQLRANQADAKLLLSQAFLVESAILTEFNHYAACIYANRFGLASTPHGNPGFTSASGHSKPNGTGSIYGLGAGHIPGPGTETNWGNTSLIAKGVTDCSAISNYMPPSKMAPGFPQTLNTYQLVTCNLLNNNGYNSRTAFTYVSAAVYRVPTQYDVWTINQNRSIQQIQAPF